MQLRTWMESNGACNGSMAWIDKRTPEEAWAECHRADWMLWALGRTKVDRKVVVRIACDIALSVLHLTNDPRVDKCIQPTLDWCDGRATIAEVVAARRESWAAWNAARKAAREQAQFDIATLIRTHLSPTEFGQLVSAVSA